MTARALLRRWPLAADVAHAQVRTVQALLRSVSNNHFKPEKAKLLVASAKASIAVTQDAEARREEIRVSGRLQQTKRGRPLLRRQLFLLAGRWCLPDGAYRAAHLALAERNGGSKISALCAVARRLVPMLLHVMQTGEPFDAVRWRNDRRDPAFTPEQAA